MGADGARRAYVSEMSASPKDPRDQRVRDPVHGLIVFRKDSDLDQLAWRLLDTAEFQRLRRIKQLGPAEFAFPSATHSRFAHCIGVFHTARKLIEIIQREIGDDFDGQRAEVAVRAALLHDLGHGPLSHAFESVQRARGQKKKHEKWSAEIVRSENGAIRPLLEGRRVGLTEEIARLLELEDPEDIYHAVVSSSFDADRLDYLRRDRLMTGTHAGAIDFDWLMEHVRVRPISIEGADEDEAGETGRPKSPHSASIARRCPPPNSSCSPATRCTSRSIFTRSNAASNRCSPNCFVESPIMPAIAPSPDKPACPRNIRC